jgi:hypothetical protein
MRARYQSAGSQMRVRDITHSCTRLHAGPTRRGAPVPPPPSLPLPPPRSQPAPPHLLSLSLPFPALPRRSISSAMLAYERNRSPLRTLSLPRWAIRAPARTRKREPGAAGRAVPRRTLSSVETRLAAPGITLRGRRDLFFRSRERRDEDRAARSIDKSRENGGPSRSWDSGKCVRVR